MIEELRQWLLPRSLVRVRGQSLQYLIYIHKKWQPVEAGSIPENGLFGQQVLLIPDAETLFRCREFPLAHVKESELAEAVALDAETWSPWEGEIDSYFWPVRSNGQWLVAVWIWECRTAVRLQDATTSWPTHVMPERAWKIAALDELQIPAVYIDTLDPEQPGGCVYAVLHEAKIPLQIIEAADEAAALRFWRSVDHTRGGAKAGGIGTPVTGHIFLDKDVDVETLSGDFLNGLRPDECHRIGQALPGSGALGRGRLQGVKDWTEPASWFRPVGVIVGLYLFWLLGSSLIQWQKGEAVSEQVAIAQSAAIDVIQLRDNVSSVHQKLRNVYQLRSRQLALETALAALSEVLPPDAWLDSLQYEALEGGWADIVGTAQRSAGLAAVLESLPEIEHAMFLNDIRKDERTGLEPFNIRLKLASQE